MDLKSLISLLTNESPQAWYQFLEQCPKDDRKLVKCVLAYLKSRECLLVTLRERLYHLG